MCKDYRVLWLTQPRSKKEEILQKSSKCSVRLSKGFDGSDLLSGKETSMHQ